MDFGLEFVERLNMNKLLPTFFYLVMMVFTIFPKNDSPFLLQIDDISSYFSSGSSKDLAKFFDNGIELNINGDHGEFSKIQAELVLRDFFKKHPPKDFQIIHKGGVENQIQYYIGNYKSINSQFRILIKIKSNISVLRIFSLEILSSDSAY